ASWTCRRSLRATGGCWRCWRTCAAGGATDDRGPDMIDLGLAGVAGDRHRLFLEPFRRRRAGVRVVGFSEPDATARDDFAVLHPAPAFADHREMLTRAGPTM